MSNDVLQSSHSGWTSWIINGIWKLSFRVATLGTGIAAVVATLLYFNQNSMLYFPEVGGLPRRTSQNPVNYRSPEEHHMPYENLYIPCADGVSIHAWLILRTQNKNDLPTLVFFHGNAGNIGFRIPNALQMIQHLNVNVMMVEYRGYGESDPVKPNEKGLKLDAQAALQFIRKHPKVNPSKIFLFGRSIGGAVAFDLAYYAQKNSIPLAGVIVENTFLSIAKMVDHLMSWVAPIKALILRIGWDSEKIVPHLQMPILFLAGRRDEIVPHQHMLDLYQASQLSSRLSQIHIVKRGTHNETWLKGGQAYWDAIKAFLAQVDNTSEMKSKTPSPLIETNSASPGDTSTAYTTSSIPIMPSGIIGIARESLRETSQGGDENSTIKKQL